MGKIEKVLEQFFGSGWGHVLVSYQLDMQTRNLTEKSIEGYIEHLGHLFRFCRGAGISGPFKVDRGCLQQYILSQQGQVSDHTINTRLRHIRAFYNWAIREELIAASPMARIRLLRADRGPKAVVGPEIIQRVLRGLSGRRIRQFEASRNRTLLLVLWDTMVRLSEIVGMETGDISVPDRLILIRGKGRKRRMVPVGTKTLKALQRWQLRYRSGLPGTVVFCDRNGDRLSTRNVRQVVERLGQKHRVKISPHLIRHSAATWYIKQGGSLERLRLILGHSSLIVTQNYLHLSAADLADGFNDLSPVNALGNI